MISWFWNRIYNGIGVHHFEHLQHQAIGHEVIYVPCHRSHLDYVLLSYLVHEHGSVPPHIAAGINLNLPILGPLLRRGGAFFCAGHSVHASCTRPFFMNTSVPFNPRVFPSSTS